MHKSSKSFESAFQLVGGNGRYQWLCMAVVNLQLLVLTWNHLGYIFIGAVPQHWCKISELENITNWSEEQIRNLTIPKNNEKFDQCKYYDIDYIKLLQESGYDYYFAFELVHGSNNRSGGGESGEGNELGLLKCDAWNYDRSVYRSTIATEFNLVCEKRYLVPFIQAFYMIGAFTGTLVFGPINDRILGRRNTNLLAIGLVLVGGFSSAFSVSYVMFIVTRIIVAVGTAGCMQSSSIWFLEHCDTKSRARMYCIQGTFFGVGYAIMPIYAYFFRDWSHLQIAFSTSATILISFYWIFPESPRWLATNGKESEAISSLLRIAKINGYPPPNQTDLLLIVRKCASSSNDDAAAPVDDETLQQTSSFQLSSSPPPRQDGKHEMESVVVAPKKPNKLLDLFNNFKILVSTKELRNVSFVIWILFVTVAFVYYGFAFTTVNLTSDPYLIVSLGALMEIPASLLPIPFLATQGRRPTLLACYTITGLSSLLIPLTTNYTAITILSMTGKLFVASAFTILYLVVSEAYPTIVRTTGQGAGTIMGRIGSIAAPFVADLLQNIYPNLPNIIFGIVGLAGAFVSLFLVETKGVDMRDQVA